jgi:zinc protease
MTRLFFIPLLCLLMSQPLASPVFAADEQRIDVAASESRRVGTLPNGLSYFIERAGTSEDKIEIQLIVRAGLADGMPADPDAPHVLEHIVMKKLSEQNKKGSYAERLSRMGGKLGRDANATTTIDMTDFSLRVPANDPAALATGLDFLVDWASPMKIDDEDIDRERKASIEEVRQSRAEAMRWETTRKHRAWYPGHPVYGAAWPAAGTAGLSADAIRSLHGRLYSPSNMAVIVVGPIDVDAVWGEISARLGVLASGLPNTSTTLAITSLSGGRFEAITHAEQRETRVSITLKNRRPPVGSPDRARDVAVRRIAYLLFRDAFRNLSDHYGAAIYSGGVTMSAEANYGQAAGVDVTAFEAIVRPNGIQAALADLLRLAATARRDGFSAEDIERARSLAVAEIEGMQDSPSAILTKYYAQFRFGAAEPAAADVRTALYELSVSEINATIGKLLDPARRDTFVIYGGGNDADVPTASEVAALAARAERGAPASLTPPPLKTPSFTPLPSLAIPPVAGKREPDGYVRWTLRHSGATLLFKRSGGDRVSLAMRRKGGLSRFDLVTAADALAAREIVEASGTGTLDRFETRRFLNANGLSIAPIVEPYREGMVASGPASAWRTIVQLARAGIVQTQCRKAAFDDLAVMRRDASTQTAIETLRRSQLDALIAATFGEPATGLPFADGDPQRICGLYATMLGNTEDMTIVVHADLDAGRIYQDVAAALDIPAVRYARPPRPGRPFGSVTGRHIVRAGTDGALIELKIRMARSYPELGAIGAALRTLIGHRLDARLRDVEKGVYGVNVGFGTSLAPELTTLNIGFSCDPANVDRLIDAVKDELRMLREAEASPAELAAALMPTGLTSRHDAASNAETWIAEGGKLRSRTSDAALARWRRDFLSPSRLAEFVLLPEQTD